MDGVAISDKKQVREYVESGNGAEIIFQVSRKDELIQVKIKPETDVNNVYKMGAWLRDSAQGIGTMTYIDSQNQFGALGHGINDMDTGELLKLGTGLLYHTEIVAVKRGEKGNPGELTGVIEYKPDQVSGVIVDNTVQGIYGVANAELLSEYTAGMEALPIALKQEVSTGPAQILCTIDGGAKYYDVEITKLTPGKEAVNRQISLEVTDEELLSTTGGSFRGCRVPRSSKTAGLWEQSPMCSCRTARKGTGSLSRICSGIEQKFEQGRKLPCSVSMPVRQ